jgi:hypothetical protein
MCYFSKILNNLNKETKDFYKKYISINKELVEIGVYPLEI